MTPSIAAAEPPKQSWLVTKALAKSTLGLLNPKLWLLSFIPLLLAGALWAGIGYFGWDIANDWIRVAIGGVDMPTWLPDWLPNRSVIAPFIVLMLTFPLLLISALVLVGVFGTGVVAQRVATQYGLTALPRSGLEKSAQWLGNVWHSLWVLTVLCVVWLMTLPAWLLAGAGMLVALVILGWANAKLFSRDVLSDFATAAQREQLLASHRSTLWGLGLLASVPAAIPTALWVSGASVFFALPFMALIAVWLSIMVFLATSLLFSHYLLAALKGLQEQEITQAAQAASIAQQALVLANSQALAQQRALDAQAIETTAVEIKALP